MKFLSPRKLRLFSLVLAGLVFASVPSAKSAALTVLNYDFESAPITLGANPVNWTPEEGGNGVYLLGGSGNGTVGPHVFVDFSNVGLGITQGLSATLENYTRYEMLVDIYASPTTNVINFIGLSAGSNAFVAGTQDIDGYGGTWNLVSAGGADGPLNLQMTNGVLPGSQTNLGPSIATGNWYTVSFSFETGASNAYAGTPLSLYVRGGSAGNWTAFDNVRLNATPVPEPSPWVLLSVSLVAVALGLRRRFARP